jgi:hypothetical protein
MTIHIDVKKWSIVKDARKDLRRNRIMEFVEKHPTCEKKAVIEYMMEKRFGSYVTTRDDIEYLLTNRYLDGGKAMKNHKSYRLNITKNNPIHIIPDDLVEITVKFKEFMIEYEKLKLNVIEFQSKSPKSSVYKRKEVQQMLQLVPSLPFCIIEIVDEIYKCYFLFILPKKIEDESVTANLYSTYFKHLVGLFQIASRGLKNQDQSRNNSTEPSDAYRNFINSTSLSKFNLVLHTASICRSIGIEDSLYKILDLVWRKNKDATSLLYDLQVSVKSSSNKQVINKYFTESIDRPNNNDILEKIHLKIGFAFASPN